MSSPVSGGIIALTKESSLLFYIGLVDVMAVSKQFGVNTYDYLEGYLAVAALYLVLTIPLSLLARRLERRMGSGRTLEAHL